MNPQVRTRPLCRIVYDDQRLASPECELFDESYWTARDGIRARKQGRGGALVVDAPFGQAVLKRFFRGGQAARWSRDKYLFNGYERSRSWREFRLLVRLREFGLPVPAPIAAATFRTGLLARCALLTQHIPECRTLAEDLRSGGSEEIWFAAGNTIRRFHDAGLYHADLNLTNILVDNDQGVYLVDFDKSRLQTPRSGWQQTNIRRLQRSFTKLAGDLDHNQACWRALLTAYQE